MSSARQRERPNALMLLCGVTLGLSVVLGGSSHTGHVSDTILQWCSLPLLALATWHLVRFPTHHSARPVLVLVAAGFALVALQLVPVPPSIWSSVQPLYPLTDLYRLLGQSAPWRGLSLTPEATLSTLASLFVPLALLCGVICLSASQRRFLCAVLVVAALVSVFLGLMQLAQGPESKLRFFEFTNNMEAVGFFANRNHFAALINSAIPFTIALAALAGASTRGRLEGRSLIVHVLAFTVIAALLAGQLMGRSRAGLALTMVALLAGIFVPGMMTSGSRSRSTGVIVGAGVVVLLLIGLQYALFRVLERFDADPLTDARIPLAQATWALAIWALPFGTGSGSFVAAYAAAERPERLVADTYINRAHNDVLEFFLETGAAGLVLLVFFGLWLALRSIKVWRRSALGDHEYALPIMRAAAVGALILAAHSFVDYPLRTGAMMAVFALLCGLLVDPPAPAADPRLEPDEAAFETALDEHADRSLRGGDGAHALRPSSAVSGAHRPFRPYVQNADQAALWTNALSRPVRSELGPQDAEQSDSCAPDALRRPARHPKPRNNWDE